MNKKSAAPNAFFFLKKKHTIYNIPIPIDMPRLMRNRVVTLLNLFMHYILLRSYCGTMVIDFYKVKYLLLLAINCGTNSIPVRAYVEKMVREQK